MASNSKLFLETDKNDNNIRNLLLTRLLTVAQIMENPLTNPLNNFLSRQICKEMRN